VDSGRSAVFGSHYIVGRNAVEDLIAQLVHQFNDAPSQFFHEEELHGVFFGLCRGNFPLVHTRDNHEVHLFRHEYDTIWRYARRDPEPYTERLTDRGVTACFDFALLSQGFVQQHELLTVINKHEARRLGLRQNPWWTEQGPSAVIDVGIEFKMAHRRHQMDIAQGQVNALRAGMLLDARKLATERVGRAYLLAFSHGPLPNNDVAAQILQAVVAEHVLRNDVQAVQLRALLATPLQTFLAGGWANPQGFPNPLPVQ
jgi:hypothetical protein